MELAKMEVSRAEIRKVHRGKLTSGMVGAEVAFSFDDAWDGLNRIAVFKAGGTVKDVLLVGESCVIPHEVLERPVHLVVGVYGTDTDGSVVIPTVWADLGMVEQGAKPSGEISKKPTPEVWAQILGMIGDLKKLNTEDKSSLVAAINEVLLKGADPEEIQKIVGAYLAENGIGGGIRDNKKFKAVQIGGPSGGCLTEEHLDMPLDFDSLTKAGAMIGSGGLVVMDEDTCMVEVARFFMNFTQNESCGKCTPCREGTKRMLEILQNIVDGKGKDGDIELLLELAETVSSNALCGLGKSAPNPVVSTIKYFRDEYEAHIYEKRCPTGTCQKLKRFVIDPELCKGCSLCSRNCPVGAITGKVKSPFTIDQDKCIKCGACMSGCKFNAIKEEF